MASYPSPQRQPLLDSRLQALISQRGRELLGLALIFLGAAMSLILSTYAPDDPSWMASSDGPVQNALGRPGATIASPVIIITGRAGWGIVLALCVWGFRLVIHRGEGNILGRSVFVPIAVALSAVWLASLVPGPGWGLDFGLGGMFGDTVLGALLTALPLSSTAGLNMLTLALFAATLALWLYVLGCSFRELAEIARFLGVGLVLSYAGFVAALAGLLRALGMAGQRWQGWRDERRQMAQASMAAAGAGGWQANHPAPHHPPHQPVMPPVTGAASQPHGQPWPGHGAQTGRAGARVLRAEPALGSFSGASAAMAGSTAGGAHAVDGAAYAGAGWHHPHQPYPPAPTLHAAPQAPHAPAAWPGTPGGPVGEIHEPPAQRPGLLARVSALGRRLAEPAPEAEPLADLPETGDESADRIRNRITDVIRARQRQKPVLRVSPAMPGAAGGPLAHGAAVPMHGVPAAGGGLPPGPAPLRPEPALRAPAPQPGAPGPFGGAPYGDPYAEPAEDAARPGARWRNRADAPEPADHDDDGMVFDDDIALAGQPEDPVPGSHVLHRRVVQPPRTRSPQPSRRARAEAQPGLRFEEAPPPAYEPPPLALLTDPGKVERYTLSDEALEENARMLESVLDDYGVRGEIVAVRPGPVVTLYELEPAPGLKASRVIGLADDIARSMSALSARVSTMPGRSVIGIELPNARREKVVLREILGCRDFGDSQMRLPIALGKDIGGEPVVANLAKMPHLLIAGTTGSGKSVAINTMILSLLYRLTPEECRLIMIDPKMLELSVYDGIPHLLSPVVTDPKKAVVALKWVVGEMEERYRKMSKMGVRNIEGFNGRVREALERGEMFKRTVQTGFDDETGDPVFETEEFAPEALPYVVVIVDEMADLMMVAGKEIEACIQRLAQMARASGIHLIMATQRPSVDVITGTIKANFPTRISFQVTSKIDSRTILGEQGAEQLLGMGDMLYMAGGARITRIHGPFVSDEEVEEVVTHLKSFGPPDYQSGVLEGPDSEREADIDAVLGLGDGSGGEDALYDQAVAIVAKDRKCSTSYIQRKLGIGYNKAARLVEQMEDQGVVSQANHVGKREVLVPEV
ncbi:MAG: DNA translocase FtsK 4TM domain-containing protein [Pararhodobacter sp.]|nr:DNA translocase FtsK 4TM domain-containing protein [Pararhodobacter sp.]